MRLVIAVERVQRLLLKQAPLLQLGDLRVLRGRSIAEEARTRGFPSPSFGEFGFVGFIVIGPRVI